MKKQVLLHASKQIQFILFLTICTTLMFCSKTNPPVPPATVTTFKFTANGTTYQWDGSLVENPSFGSKLGKYTYNGATWFSLSAMPLNGGIYSLISLKIQTSTLSATSYNLTATTVTPWTTSDHYFGVVATQYASSEPGDFATINISSIHNGYADGTFTASLTNSPNGTSTKLAIINGEFHNVPIVQ